MVVNNLWSYFEADVIDTAWSKLKQTLANSDDFEGTDKANGRCHSHADKVCQHHPDYVLLQRFENPETHP